ncbi:hypothetical protein, partial [Streptomyces sp. NPDC059063]|uniref:hypothetical protein n=1 Tax=Streptomyces sp. NPDC059063 TaxID=3346712 RepID=UPI00367D6948
MRVPEQGGRAEPRPGERPAGLATAAAVVDVHAHPLVDVDRRGLREQQTAGRQEAGGPRQHRRPGPTPTR